MEEFATIFPRNDSIYRPETHRQSRERIREREIERDVEGVLRKILTTTGGGRVIKEMTRKRLENRKEETEKCKRNGKSVN